MRRNIFILGAALVFLTGCSTTRKGVLSTYERPADIATDGIYGDAQSATDQSLGDLSWREVFTDTQLQALIEKALTQNVNVKNTDLRLQEVQYALKASKLAFIPSLSFAPQGTVTKMFDPYDRSQYAGMTAGNTKSYSLPLSFGWQNVNFFQLRNAKKDAKVSLEQMQNAKQAVQAQLVAAVAQLYYNLCMLDEQLSMMQQTEANWATYVDMQHKLMTAGQANAAAVASIEATHLSIKSSVITLQDNIRILENNLSTLLGESSQRYSRSSLSGFHAPTVMSTGLPIQILSRRPDVRDAELTLAKSFYDVASARAAFWPSISLSANGQFTNSLGSAIINPGMMIGNALASLAQPIFANGRLRANLKITKAEYEVAANDFQQAVIEAGNEVNTANVELTSAQEQEELLAGQVNALQRALDATQQLYTYGNTNYLNVITAQNSLIQARMSYLQNRMDAIQATISLYQALGGGTK